jgi:hypothetical protein
MPRRAKPRRASVLKKLALEREAARLARLAAGEAPPVSPYTPQQVEEARRALASFPAVLR